MSSILDALAGDGPGAAHGVETEDLDVTVVAWPEGYVMQAHRNLEVDVVSIVLSGEGEAIVDGESLQLRPGSLLVVEKGAERSYRSLSPDFRYVNVHKRKRKLMPQTQKPQ